MVRFKIGDTVIDINNIYCTAKNANGFVLEIQRNRFLIRLSSCKHNLITELRNYVHGRIVLFEKC